MACRAHVQIATLPVEFVIHTERRFRYGSPMMAIFISDSYMSAQVNPERKADITFRNSERLPLLAIVRVFVYLSVCLFACPSHPMYLEPIIMELGDNIRSVSPFTCNE